MVVGWRGEMHLNRLPHAPGPESPPPGRRRSAWPSLRCPKLGSPFQGKWGERQQPGGSGRPATTATHLLSHHPLAPGLPPRDGLLGRKPVQDVSAEARQRALPALAAGRGPALAGGHHRPAVPARQASRCEGRLALPAFTSERSSRGARRLPHLHLNRPARLMILGTSSYREAKMRLLVPPLLQGTQREAGRMTAVPVRAHARRCAAAHSTPLL